MGTEQNGIKKDDAIMNEAALRNAEIIRWNKYSIILNVLLSSAKLIVGILIDSMAIVIQAMEGFATMLISVISIISAKVAGRHANKAHPLGYGRVEYLSSMLVTVVILFLGEEAIRGSISGLIHIGEAPEYNIYVVILLLISLAAKLFFGRKMKEAGKRIRSTAVLLEGEESEHQALSSIAVLIAIVVHRIFGINIEPLISIILSIFLIRTGIKLLISNLHKLLGGRVPQEVRRKVLKGIAMEPGVLNAYNLVLHNYGENIYVGSVDIEVEETMQAAEISRISRRIMRKGREFGIIITSVGINGSNLSDDRAAEIWDRILMLSGKHKEIHRMHAFMADFEEKVISFTVMFNREARNTDEVCEQFKGEITELFPDMTVEISEGIDF